MKKFFLLSVLVLSLGLVSCEKETEVEIKKNEDIKNLVEHRTREDEPWD